MKNYRKMTEEEAFELNSLSSYFNKLMLERYPNTIITTELTAKDCKGGEDELTRLDEIYASRLDEITDEYKDQFLVERMYELIEIQANDLSSISFDLNNQMNDYTRENEEFIKEQKRLLVKEITDGIIEDLLRKFFPEN